MSRYRFCQSSVAIGNGSCQCWRPEDIARLARVLFTTAKIGIVALLLGIVLVLTVQWAFPLQVSPGSGGAKHFAVQPAVMSAGDRDVDRAAELFLARFEDGSMSGNAAITEPRELP